MDHLHRRASMVLYDNEDLCRSHDVDKSLLDDDLGLGGRKVANQRS